ncbi:MAG TPA: MBL fold metallo-hydrolase [Anaerolineaceae bacterium]|nr:MBL fold metallo-hydrolase [Anaerolineaceae bacterium]
MKITFNGAAQTVTGSQYLLEANGAKLLLECGLFQGRRAQTYEQNRTFRFQPPEVDAMILSHAHIDHSGNLPNLVKRGFTGLIYTTKATARLSGLMLLDSAHIQESDVRFVNRKRERRGETPVEPLYTSQDAEDVMPLFQPMDYGAEFEPIPGVTARLLDAGHILGSAAIVLDIKEKGRRYRLWFSGDIGREKLPLLQDPVLPEAADYLMMECTYGDKPHRDPQLAYEELRTVVNKTIERGGKVIIPAFAVGRTQEIVYSLNTMMSNREMPKIPVYVDSPLAVNISQVFQEFTDYFDAETRQFVREHHHPALDFPQLTYIRSVDESKALNDRHDPMIIISASGMAETGRILHHLRNNIENPKNMILIVSWQAPNTLGRRLADRETEVNIFGERFQRRAEVATIGGLSAHAGQKMLVKYARETRSQLQKVILVHGESKPAQALREKLMDEDIGPIHYPGPGQSMDI